MRSRLIAVLAGLLMLAPVAGFARTTPVRMDHIAQTSSKKKKKMKKMKHKKMKKNKKSKKGKK